MLLRTPAAVTPDKWRVVKRDPEFFMPGTLRVRGYRQREAGARSRYSHRDLYGGADDQARRFSAAYWHCRVFFPVWPLPLFCAFPASPRKERPR